MTEYGPNFELQGASEDRIFGRFPALRALPDLAHGISTRQGADFSDSADSPEFGRAARAMGSLHGLREVAWLRQVHGNRVIRAESGGCQGDGDALVSVEESLGLLGRSADCPLILVAGPPRASGMAHASWRGTVKQITLRMVRELTEIGGMDPENLVAAVCPSAGPCCYEVGPEVERAALEGIGEQAADFFSRRAGKLVFDLWRANAEQLRKAGIPERNIHVAGLCTICNEELFPSYRRDGSDAGRFAGLVGWRRRPTTR